MIYKKNAIDRAYERLNTILHRSGFTVDRKNHVAVMSDCSVYFNVNIVEKTVGEFTRNASEKYPIKRLNVEVTFKAQNRTLDGCSLFILSEEARHCSNIMKCLESTPITFIDIPDGEFVQCKECSYWKDQNDNDYGTCTCKYSTACGCRTISYHDCKLK